MRVNAIVNELNGEKIDIVPWSENPAEFIAAALSPATVLHVSTNLLEKTSLAVVPDDKLSLAIGKSGQNVRLAHRLTGWKIDIKSLSQLEKDEAERVQNYDYNEEDYSEDENYVSDELQEEIEEEMNQQGVDEDDLSQDEIDTTEDETLE